MSGLPGPDAKYSQTSALLAVDPAEVAVPADGDNVGKQDSVLERQEGKVDGLHKRPHHPVGLQGRPPSLLEALLGTVSFHGSHAAEEHANHDGCKQGLVAGNAGKSFDSRVSEANVAG